MSIITNRELRDLWADAAKIKEAISGGKVAVADAAVLAKLEAMRVLLAGTLSTADAAAQTELAQIKAALGGLLNVSDAEVRAELALIKAALLDVLNVSDENVLAKLETLRTLLAGTINTSDANVLATLQQLQTRLAAIETKLNGTLLTQLTGSNALKGAVQNVTTAGTRVQLPNYPCREVTIIAKRTNTGRIYVGGSDVSSAVYGADLGPQDSITLSVSNTNLIYIDASVSGEGISYVAIS